MIWGRDGGLVTRLTFLTGREMPGFKEATREWFR